MKLSVIAAVLLALSTGVSITAQPQSSSQSLLQHRHSFVPSLPVEPTDENLKVARHQVQIVGLSGFREWEVKGSLEGLAKAAGKVFLTEATRRVTSDMTKESHPFHLKV